MKPWKASTTESNALEIEVQDKADGGPRSPFPHHFSVRHIPWLPSPHDPRKGIRRSMVDRRQKIFSYLSYLLFIYPVYMPSNKSVRKNQRTNGLTRTLRCDQGATPIIFPDFSVTFPPGRNFPLDLRYGISGPTQSARLCAGHFVAICSTWKPSTELESISRSFPASHQAR